MTRYVDVLWWPWLAIVAIALAACRQQRWQQVRRVDRTRRPPRSAKAPTAARSSSGAEQERDCADWINAVLVVTVGPRDDRGTRPCPACSTSRSRTASGRNVPSPTMAGMPTVTTVERQADGHLQDRPDNAVWSDGEPITSDDFKYTADQINNGKNIYDPHRLRPDRERCDAVDPRSVVVTFKAAVRELDPALRLRLRHPAVAHPRRVRTAHASMKDGYTGPVVRGSPSGTRAIERHLTPNPNCTGHEAEDREGDLQDHRRHRRGVPGVQVGPGAGDLPAAAARRGRRDRPGPAGRATRSTTPRPARPRRCGSTTRSRRSTRRRSARPSATPSTATRS